MDRWTDRSMVNDIAPLHLFRLDASQVDQWYTVTLLKENVVFSSEMEPSKNMRPNVTRDFKTNNQDLCSF